FNPATPSSRLLSVMAPSPRIEAPPATIPTQILTTPPQHRFAPPLRTPALRMVDGMLEEVTQPFEMLWPAKKLDPGFPPTLDAIVNDPGDWRKRQLEAFTCLSPVSSRGGSDL